jgi:hypothetical protein
MKLKNVFGLIIIVLACFLDCSDTNDQSNNDLVVYKEGDIEITFLDIRDSRCPINAVCIWQGNAEVDLSIKNSVDTVDFTLNTAGFLNDSLNFPSSAIIFDLNIELLNVQPFPEDGKSFKLEDYTVSISVTK